MVINWINRADEMPPNNHDIQLIAKGSVIKKVNAGFIHWRIDRCDRHLIDWTEYPQEKWEFLNKS